MINEKLLIDHCSLTLSSLKTASLFTVNFNNVQDLYACISSWNEKFYFSGIKITLLHKANKRALIYVYRESMLKNDIRNLHAKNILHKYGYTNLSTKTAINKLAKRFKANNTFPHEIGLFLGYPPKDVEGFICNGGKNCSLCKYWKVYTDTECAMQKFARYDKCTAIYKKLWNNGRDILKLTVKEQIAA